MEIFFDTSGTREGFNFIVNDILKNNQIKGLLILACDQNGFTPENIDDVLKKIKVPLFGGIFPGIIHNNKLTYKGTIIAGFTKEPNVKIIQELSNSNHVFENVLEDLFPEKRTGKTMFVFVDGYSQRISSLIESLYNICGLKYNYIGGGAGSINPSALDMSRTPCLFTNDGLIRDSALLVLTDIESSMGVNHGWHKISGPYKVTESNGNNIVSIDWEPAFKVYKRIIKECSEKIISSENFFEIAKQFPFGISRMGSEYIVRDPFTVNGQSLVVATEIPKESFIDVLTGDFDSLVNAAKKSYVDAVKNYQGKEVKTIFMIDCISRALFFDEKFNREIDAVYHENLPLIGALTLGEIANCGKTYMELYNKTCVIGVLGDS